LAQYLKWAKNENVISVGRNFQDQSEKFAEADWVIHLAGVNRGETEQDVYNGNIQLAKDLLSIFDKNKTTPNVVFISSIQESLGNVYGNSKIEASRLVGKHCNDKHKNFISLRVPNVFGPFCKPNYNSFVATFCNEIAKGGTPTIHKDSEVPLMYVQDVCEMIHNSIHNPETSDFAEKITTQKVSTVLNKLNYFNDLYQKEGVFPELYNDFDINLFNTFRSYLDPTSKLTQMKDDRGYLVEIVKCKLGQSQVFYSVTKPNITRGNHFHFRKIERFIVLKGTALIEMRKVATNEVLSWTISDTDNLVIDMPVLYTHSLKNIGSDDLVCCFWTHEIFDPSNPDTYFQNVTTT